MLHRFSAEHDELRDQLTILRDTADLARNRDLEAAHAALRRVDAFLFDPSCPTRRLRTASCIRRSPHPSQRGGDGGDDEPHARRDRPPRPAAAHPPHPRADGPAASPRTRSTTYWRACTDCTRCCRLHFVQEGRNYFTLAPESDAAPTADAAGDPHGVATHHHGANPPTAPDEAPLAFRSAGRFVGRPTASRTPDLAGRGRVVTQNVFGVTTRSPKPPTRRRCCHSHRTLAYSANSALHTGSPAALSHVGSACSASCTGMSLSRCSASSSRESNRTPYRLGSCGFTQALEPFGRRACDPTPPTRIARPAVVSFPTFAPDAGTTAVW